MYLHSNRVRNLHCAFSSTNIPGPNSNLLHTHYGDEFSGVIDDDESPPPPLPKKKSQTNSPGCVHLLCACVDGVCAYVMVCVLM